MRDKNIKLCQEEIQRHLDPQTGAPLADGQDGEQTTDGQGTPVPNTELRDKIQVALLQGKSQAALAKSAGISGSALSQYLYGTYKGNVKAVESKLRIALNIRGGKGGSAGGNFR